MKAKLTVVICTHNRSAYLKKALESLKSQTLSRDEFEVVVVDNGSTDGTRHVVDEFSDQDNLSYVHEPVLGLSRARNTGIAASSGEYVAFLDDDAVAQPRWAAELLAAFQEPEDEPAVVGGKVEPIWEAPRPAWLSDAILVYLGIIDLSPTPFISTTTPTFCGANMAFLKTVLEQTAGFDLSVGRVGKCLLSNEEILLWERIKAIGGVGYYSPQIVVGHHVPASRLTQKNCLRRLYWEGVSQAVGSLLIKPQPSYVRVWRSAKSIGRSILVPQRLSAMLRRTENPTLFDRKCRVMQDLGYAAGMLGLIRGKA